MKYIFPDTTKRVEQHTNEQVNSIIKRQTFNNISMYTDKFALK